MPSRSGAVTVTGLTAEPGGRDSGGVDTVRPAAALPGTGTRATPIGRVAYGVTFGVLTTVSVGCWAFGWESIDMIAGGRRSPEGMETFSGQIVWVLTMIVVLLLWIALLGFEIAAGHEGTRL